MSRQTMLVTAALAVIGGLFALGTYVYRAKRAEALGFMAEQSFATFVPAHAARMGPSDAKVYLTEFFDPACETCAQMSPFVKQLLLAHEGKVQLAARCLPLHDGSEAMCRLLEAAKRQGKFWEALEVMFSTQSVWASHDDPHPELVWGFLGRTGLDLEALRRDAGAAEVVAAIEQDRAAAQQLGVRMTPEFFVNGAPLDPWGARELQMLVQAHVARAYGR